MARKKSRYKPKHVRRDVLGWVLEGLKPVVALPVCTDIRIKNHAAMQALCAGTGGVSDVDVLINAFNMCEAYTMLDPRFGCDWVQEIGQGLDALLAVGRRGLQSGRFVLRAAEMNALNTVLEIHDAQLEQSTVQEMEAALEIVLREYRAKRMRPIIEREVCEELG